MPSPVLSQAEALVIFSRCRAPHGRGRVKIHKKLAFSELHAQGLCCAEEYRKSKPKRHWCGERDLSSPMREPLLPTTRISGQRVLSSHTRKKKVPNAQARYAPSGSCKPNRRRVRIAARVSFRSMTNFSRVHSSCSRFFSVHCFSIAWRRVRVAARVAEALSVSPVPAKLISSRR